MLISNLKKVLDTLEPEKRCLWLGALSFEERSPASLTALTREGIVVEQAVVLDYETAVYPPHEANIRRSLYKKMFNNLAKRRLVGEVQFIKIPSHSFQAIQDLAARSLVSIDFLILDVTCMTKIHALALAAFLATEKRSNWVLAYSRPENYGMLADPTPGSGWKDIITLPLSPGGHLFNETYSRGIVFTGHEADRLIVGLAELQPSGGLLISSSSGKRPDLALLSLKKNRKMIRELMTNYSASWKSEVVDIGNLHRLKELVTAEARRARKHSAPVILFPFGPKPPLFFCGLYLCSEYPEASWFVYPIPARYSVHYTEGVEDTLWFSSDPGLIPAWTRQ